MPANCLSCGTPVSRSKPAVRCFLCVNEAHLNCLGIPSDVLRTSGRGGGMKWVCDGCCTGDKEVPRNNHNNNIDIKLDKIMSDLTAITSQQAKFMDSLNFYGNKIDDFELKMAIFEDINSKLHKHDAELNTLVDENTDIRRELIILQQQLKSKNLDVIGIPERKNENILTIVEKIASKLGIPNVGNFIEGCYRIHYMPKVNLGTRPIVIDFKNKSYRDEFLRAYRGDKQKIKTSDIGFDGVEETIYVNEKESPYYRKLFKSTRQFCRDNNYKYCWVQDGRLLVRRTDSSRIFRIFEAELNKLPKE
ncbi:uncharacterized protein LOC123317820 [Coccinella septempunctata]|uniref:uncharacterized protein LOC123317820 n=1 Tax=Coccinella septempunctata TaxID=41139 RepID=UPI001D070425|nr:uncharacterized protein LOC123317820 [Coccinella septempunctata]